MPNWAANDIFSQTRKLAIVTGPIGGLGRKIALALAADGALQ
jgi:NAD(P)-dependent dehydrogenase (short-subunit alcohol dehydrogenase family)